MFRIDSKTLQSLSSITFEKLAFDIFKYQSKNNPVYAKYLKLVEIKPGNITGLNQIPFLPIELFKTNIVKTGNWKEETIFQSTGTSGQPSIHYVRDLSFYQELAAFNFQRFYGKLNDYDIYALLPGYVGSTNNSLIAMISHFIEKSGSLKSGFFLTTHGKLVRLLSSNSEGKKRLLIGVSHALLDFALRNPVKLKNTIIMETGGMKGRKKEITRKELHDILKSKLDVGKIHSEYGMAELTSQGYSIGDGYFEFPNWMRIIIRDITNPFQRVTNGKAGGINVIDLSNYQTCSFIETKDLGRMKNEKKVEILGRFDNSDVRGCNLLVR
jgi:phenylacetate-coenzyme A ligase PaaK-like adenylate-forming protein